MSMDIVTFPDENTNFVAPSWQDLQELTFRLAKSILESPVWKNSESRPFDRVITLAKGGWPMARSLVDLLAIDQVASIGVKFYDGINSRLPEPEIYQELPISVRGERVILFDDVADSGESLIFVRDHLLSSGVEQVVTATLMYKQKSKIKPDFFGSTTEAWIIFPHEQRESIEILGKKWLKRGMSESEIALRLIRLGCNPDCVSYFWPLK